METCSVACLQVRIRRGTWLIPQHISHVCSESNHTPDESLREFSWELLLPCVRNHKQSRGSLGQLRLE